MCWGETCIYACSPETSLATKASSVCSYFHHLAQDLALSELCFKLLLFLRRLLYSRLLARKMCPPRFGQHQKLYISLSFGAGNESRATMISKLGASSPETSGIMNDMLGCFHVCYYHRCYISSHVFTRTRSRFTSSHSVRWS